MITQSSGGGSKKQQHDSLKSSGLDSFQQNHFGATTKASCLQPSSLKDSLTPGTLGSLFRGTFAHSSSKRQSTGKLPQKTLSVLFSELQPTKFSPSHKNDSDFLPFSVDFQSVIKEESLLEERVTEKKRFMSRLNPHELLRREQAMDGALWYAAYDGDMLEGAFERRYGGHEEQRSLRIQGFGLGVSEGELAIAADSDASTFVKLYRITINQLLDLAILKNGQSDPVLVKTQAGSRDYELVAYLPGQILDFDLVRYMGSFDGLPVYSVT